MSRIPAKALKSDQGHGHESDGEGDHEDLVLIRRVLRGAPAAIDQLSRRLGRILRTAQEINHRLGSRLDPDEVRDVAQDSAVALLERLKEYKGKSSFDAWTYRFCYWQIKNAIRRKAKWRRQVPTENEELDGHAPQDARALLDLERIDSVLTRIGGDPERVVRLRLFQELSFPEIALELGRPLNTVRSLYFRARAELRAKLSSSG